MVPESKSDMTLSQLQVYRWFKNLQYPVLTTNTENIAKALEKAPEPPIRDPKILKQTMDELRQGGFIAY